MNKINLIKKFIGFAMISICFSSLAKDPLLSLKNLERERASYLAMALTESDGDIDKQLMVNRKLRQLSDMERMVIRDDRLLNQDSNVVSHAFENYELTFLVHASAENQTNTLSHWLNQVGFDSKAILKAQPGYRK